MREKGRNQQRPAHFSVLIVDENPQRSRLLQEVLELSGCMHTTVAHCQREALSLLHTAPMDILVCDSGLPPMMLGMEFVRFLRTDPESPALSLPILVLMDRHHISLLEGTEEESMATYIAKPCTVGEIQERIITLLDPSSHSLLLERRIANPSLIPANLLRKKPSSDRIHLS